MVGRRGPTRGPYNHAEASQDVHDSLLLEKSFEAHLCSRSLAELYLRDWHQVKDRDYCAQASSGETPAGGSSSESDGVDAAVEEDCGEDEEKDDEMGV